MTKHVCDAGTLMKLLKAKHTKDVFVPECKDGPTWQGSHLRLDGWAMKRAWTHPLSIGYEVKVSRGDFLSDDKWHGYLDYCNEFYFVCPAGMIQLDELPPEAGLLCASKTGTRLYTKKKAQRREVEIPECFYRYILMARCHIVRSHFSRYTRPADENPQFWQQWLEDRTDLQDLGKRISKALRDTIATQITAVQDENDRLEQQMKQYEGVIQFLQSIGIEPGAYCEWKSLKHQVKDRYEGLIQVLPEGFLQDVIVMGSRCESLAEHLRVIRNAATAPDEINAPQGQAGEATP